MYPVGKQINDNALQPYLAEQIDYKVALDRAQAPLRTFMFKHTREKDLSVFYSISKMEAPRSKEEVPTMGQNQPPLRCASRFAAGSQPWQSLSESRRNCAGSAFGKYVCPGCGGSGCQTGQGAD